MKNTIVLQIAIFFVALAGAMSVACSDPQSPADLITRTAEEINESTIATEVARAIAERSPPTVTPVSPVPIEDIVATAVAEAMTQNPANAPAETLSPVPIKDIVATAVAEAMAQTLTNAPLATLPSEPTTMERLEPTPQAIPRVGGAYYEDEYLSINQEPVLGRCEGSGNSSSMRCIHGVALIKQDLSVLLISFHTLNDDGAVSGDRFDSISDIAAGQKWAFEVQIIGQGPSPKFDPNPKVSANSSSR